MAELKVRLVADTGEAERGIKDFGKKAEGTVESSFSKVGDEIAAGIGDALKEAGISVEKFESLIKASGGTLDEFAADIQAAAINSQGFEKALSTVGRGSGSLTTQLRQIKNEISQLEQSGQTGSKAFQDLQIAAARLQDQIGDTNARVRALASDTANLDAVIGAVQGLAAAGQVAAGAFALFGNANENVLKTLVKLQGALSLAQGAQQLLNTVNKDSIVVLKAQQLAQKATAVATAASTAVMSALGVATTATSGAFRVLRIALISTGIGALVVGVGFLISKIIEWTNVTEKIKEEQEALNKVLDETKRKIQEQSQVYDNAIGRAREAAEDAALAARARGASESEVTAIIRKGYDEQIRLAKERAEKITQSETLRLEAEKQLGRLIRERTNFENNLKVAAIGAARSRTTAVKQVTKSISDEQKEAQKLLETLNAIKNAERLEVLPSGSIAQLNQEIAALKRQQELTFDPQVFANYSREIDKVTEKIKAITGELKPPDIEEGGGTNLLAQIFGETQDIAKIQEEIQAIGQNIAGVFENVFGAIADGQSPIKAIENVIKQLVIRLLAAAAAAAVLSALLPGGQVAALGGFKGILGQFTGFKFASGGVATRPTLGVFGEAGPEAVIPLSQLANIIGNAGGGGATTVTGSIRGNEIYLTNQRAGASYSRLFG